LPEPLQFNREIFDKALRNAWGIPVLDEEVHGIRNGPDVFCCPCFGYAPGRLVLKLALDFLRFLPRTSSSHATELGPVLSPTEMLPALAAAGKLIPCVFAVIRMADEYRDNRRAHDCASCESEHNGSAD
jgi:hypothetical protein